MSSSLPSCLGLKLAVTSMQWTISFTIHLCTSWETFFAAVATTIALCLSTSTEWAKSAPLLAKGRFFGSRSVYKAASTPTNWPSTVNKRKQSNIKWHYLIKKSASNQSPHALLDTRMLVSMSSIMGERLINQEQTYCADNVDLHQFTKGCTWFAICIIVVIIIGEYRRWR